MIEKISHLAQHAATSSSRRQFLGRAAVWAAGLAVALAGALTPRQAQAAGVAKKCCLYINSYGLCGKRCVDASSDCPATIGKRGRLGECWLYAVYGVGSCRECA